MTLLNLPPGKFRLVHSRNMLIQRLALVRLLRIVLLTLLALRGYVSAELVRAHLEGSVTSSDIPELAGQTWALSLVFDTSAAEVPFTATSPLFAEYFNTGTVKVLRSLDFSVGETGLFTFHLVDPVPRLESDVRIDIDNFSSKTFFVHVNDESLLPTWAGLQLDSFLLGLEDSVPGGYADGTDHLPGPDATIGVNEFNAFAQVRIGLGPTGLFVGTPTAFTLNPVPELSTGFLCALAGALLVLKMRHRSRKLRRVASLGVPGGCAARM